MHPSHRRQLAAYEVLRQAEESAERRALLMALGAAPAGP